MWGKTYKQLDKKLAYKCIRQALIKAKYGSASILCKEIAKKLGTNDRIIGVILTDEFESLDAVSKYLKVKRKIKIKKQK